MGGGPPQNRDLRELVRRIAAQGPFKSMPTTKRIRLLFNGAMIADTTSALYVWEHEYYPQYYVPMESLFQPPGYEVCLSHGEAIKDDHDKIIGGGLQLAVRPANTQEEYRVLSEMVLFAADLEGPASPLRNYVKVIFDAVDQWFEEDTPIYVHPKDPYKRVDTLHSTTPIRITIPINNEDIILAESPVSVHLYETLLPPRYYLPYTSLKTIYLRPSKSVSECPYKGVAQYHSVYVKGQMMQDLVWWYRAPTADCIAVTGMRCFYNEKVDVWIMEGSEWKKLDRPSTHFV